MKSTERHKLKQNEFGRTVAQAREVVAERQREITTAIIAVVALLVAVGGYFAFRASRDGKATTLLASALAVAEAPIMAPPPPAPGSPPPIQPPGTYRTERERSEAALPRLQSAADAYPNTEAGITARFRLAATLAELGRNAEAEQRYQEVVQKTTSRNIYHYTAQLGLGEARLAQGKATDAMSTFQALATDGNSQLPIDGVLMQLGRAALVAGKKDDASRAFNRVVQEFPQSLYVTEARERLVELKKA
jgi:predicted negative regulator of RcsB-dependent stress response